LNLQVLGAGFFITRSVRGQRNRCTACCAFSFNTSEGTVVKEESNMEKMLVSGVAADKKCSADSS